MEGDSAAAWWQKAQAIGADRGLLVLDYAAAESITGRVDSLKRIRRDRRKYFLMTTPNPSPEFQRPIRMPFSAPSNPKACRSHITTAMTTTILRMRLIFASIGI